MPRQCKGWRPALYRADFAISFKEGKTHILLGECKYAEYYTPDRPLQYSEDGTDRLKIYGPARVSSVVGGRKAEVEDLFYDPFDQLMRHHLLASEMEKAREMGADVISVLHGSPRE